MQIALLIAAGVAFVAAFVLRSAKTDNGAFAWAAFGAGIVLAAAAFVAPNVFKPTTDVTIAITAPEEGAVVAAGERFPVEVDVTGGKVASSEASSSGGHLHLYVDGRLLSMPYSTKANVKLEPGTHEVTVEYVDLQHASFDPPIQANVTVEAKSGG